MLAVVIASLSCLHKGDALMLAAGRRTYLPMSVLAGMLLIAFVAYILLYRKLSPPRTLASNSSDSHEDIMSMQVMVNGNCETEEEGEVKEEEGEVKEGQVKEGKVTENAAHEKEEEEEEVKEKDDEEDCGLEEEYIGTLL